MRLLLCFFSLLILVSASCSKHKEQVPDAVPIPDDQVKENYSIPPTLPQNGVMEPTIAVKILKKGDDINCENACKYILYCNLKEFNKEPRRIDFIKCMRSCKQMTTDTDKIRSKILLGCVEKHIEGDCNGLKKCMIESLKSAKARIKEEKKIKDSLSPMK